MQPPICEVVRVQTPVCRFAAGAGFVAVGQTLDIRLPSKLPMKDLPRDERSSYGMKVLSEAGLFGNIVLTVHSAQQVESHTREQPISSNGDEETQKDGNHADQV
jgi:hypothetical protein